MKKNRIIIENRSEKLTDVQAVEHALSVMRGGKISGSGERSQYCYGSTFADKTVVWAQKNRGGSDRLVVMDDVSA